MGGFWENIVYIGEMLFARDLSNIAETFTISLSVVLPVLAEVSVLRKRIGPPWIDFSY